MRSLMELKLDWFHYCQIAISVLIDNSIQDKYFHKTNVIQPKVFDDFFQEGFMTPKEIEDTTNRMKDSLDFSRISFIFFIDFSSP